MNQNLKTYKLYKVKNFIKNPPLILIFHTLNLKTTDWLKIEQNLINSDLKYYKIRNTLAKHVLKNSVFLNFSTVLNGSLCFIYPKNNKNFNNNFQKLSKMAFSLSISSVLPQPLEPIFVVRPHSKLRNLSIPASSDITNIT